MLIGGLQKFSLLDYPGKICAIVFTQGCNFRCRFCYNPMLVWPIVEEGSKSKYARKKITGRQKVHPLIKPDELFVFLESRASKLDAVVITGGEPCLQKDLVEFVKKIKALGYLVKLDTNGSFPEVLRKLFKEKLIDYIAMDLKAPAEKYEAVTGVKVHPVKSGKAGAEQFNGVNFKNILKSVKLIMESGLPYEFRTTAVPGLIDKEAIPEMGKIIKGAPVWYLQNFKSGVDLVSEEFKGKAPYNSRQMKEMAESGKKYVKKCEVR